jgi:hypothetical protein
MNEIELRALQMMVTIIAQSLLTGRPFAELLQKFDKSIATNLFPFPGVSAVEGDHLTAEFRDAWVNLSRMVQMLPPLP